MTLKGKLVTAGTIGLIILSLFYVLFQLTFPANYRAKNWGGTLKVNLEPGQKLETITWKDDEVWYLTRQMREDEHPEEHRFAEKSSYGILEGTVVVSEHAKSPQ